MKLIIPMAGRGTRVRPHSHTTPKPLLPVAGTMIVERIVQTFGKTLNRNIDEICFVLGEFGDEVKETLAEMSARQNAKATFFKQDEAKGTAHAVYCAADALEGEVIIVFADTLFDTDTKVEVEGADSVIWLKEVEDPSRFGVAVMEGDNIKNFVEKPSEPISNLAIIGVYYFKDGSGLKKEIKYLLDNNVVGHGDEYQLTDALDRLLQDGKTFKSATVDEWLDCGTLPAWLETTGVITAKEQQKIDASKYPDSKIIEPVFLGEGVQIKNSEVGPNVSIESGTVISDSKVSNTLIQSDTTISKSIIKDSTIGNNVSVSGAKGVYHLGDHSEVHA